MVHYWRSFKKQESEDMTKIILRDLVQECMKGLNLLYKVAPNKPIQEGRNTKIW